MDVFVLLLTKLIPLYVLIVLGLIAGNYLKAQKETISGLLIYLIYPVVAFTAIVTIGITPAKLALPLVVFTVSCSLCLLFYWLSSKIWNDATRNLLAFSAGNANTGYFGIPVALAVLDEKLIGIYILAVIGITFFENTLGFFITAKGHHTAKESLQKLLKLPTLYALILGVIVSSLHIKLPAIYFDTAANFRAAFTLLGMMVIGLGLASIKEFKFDFKFVGMAFLARFVGWPLAMASIVFLDVTVLHLWDESIHKILLLISFMPLAANMVIFATQLKTHPEKAAVAVLISTLFALVYTPLMVTLFLQ